MPGLEKTLQKYKRANKTVVVLVKEQEEQYSIKSIIQFFSEKNNVTVAKNESSIACKHEYQCVTKNIMDQDDSLSD